MSLKLNTEKLKFWKKTQTEEKEEKPSDSADEKSQTEESQTEEAQSKKSKTKEDTKLGKKTDAEPVEDDDSEEANDDSEEDTSEEAKKPSCIREFWNAHKPKRTLKERWHIFIHGTEDHPRHPFSLVARIYRWYLKKFRGYVDYITTMYDTNYDEIRYDKDLVPRNKVSRDAVHVTGQKKTYHLDLDLMKRGFDVRRDHGFTASSAFNYMKNNAMNDAMVYDQDSFSKTEIDKNKLLLICSIIFGAFLAFYFVVMPMYM